MKLSSSILLISSLFTQYSLATLTLCSTENTSSGPSFFSIYQSQGLCTEHCQGSAYAIVFNQNCFCTDVTPATTIDTGLCDDPCPGYPYETCGDVDKKYYGYIQIGNPSSTAVHSSASSSASA